MCERKSLNLEARNAHLHRLFIKSGHLNTFPRVVWMWLQQLFHFFLLTEKTKNQALTIGSPDLYLPLKVLTQRCVQAESFHHKSKAAGQGSQAAPFHNAGSSVHFGNVAGAVEVQNRWDPHQELVWRLIHLNQSWMCCFALRPASGVLSRWRWTRSWQPWF